MLLDKYEFIKQQVKNKEVLDIGCVELLGDYTPENLQKTQHLKIKPYAKRLVGVDLEKEGVDALNQLDCECYVSLAEDAHKLNIGKFDVILLGDIIEHIPNPNFFLMSLRPLLNPDGLIICSTPNALAYHLQVFLLLKKKITRHQHVAWYCKVTLNNLFKLSGFTVCQFYYGVFWNTSKHIIRKWVERIIFKVNKEYAPLLLGIYKMNKEFNIQNKEKIQKQRIF